LLIGVNDWQGGAELERFRAEYATLLAGLRQTNPNRPIVAITPLWVAPSWQPAQARFPLEAYRQVIRDVVEAQADRHLRLVEGPSLVDHDPEWFDAVAVHPNDAGFAKMAERLAVALAAALERNE